MDCFFIETRDKGLSQESRITLERWTSNLQEFTPYQIFYQKLTKKSNTMFKYLHGHVIPMISRYMYVNGIKRIQDTKGNLHPIDVDSLYKIIMTEFFFNYTEINGQFYKTIGKARRLTNTEMNILVEQIMHKFNEEYHIPFLSYDEFVDLLHNKNQTSVQIVESLIS